ncbi:pre-rRNA-processing protein TSR2 homolog [Microcaecilia unicolor]|uniref:Pre-rRNA-processing protein TSR2 homolog n=1 Tax=Microcaecilia unicolor TaxID=1415580 RepID=A0A6P7X9Z0_9AMPH|nr:pre-rRNA-processing protein TSR2 homolog [Microcaecilia unicolor]
MMASRVLLAESVRAALGAWPVLQIAVENGFGGPHSQEKAEWMVGVVEQYFQTNADLQQYEVEDFLAEILNNEFDTMVEDGSLPQVAHQLCSLFQQCQKGEEAAVRERISQLSQSKTKGKITVVQSQVPEESEEEVPMETLEAIPTMPTVAPTAPSPPDVEIPAEDDDGWIVVQRKK